MKLKTMRHLGAFIGLCIATIFVTFTFENLLWGIITFVGGGFMYLSGDAFIYQCRMWSTCFFANIGKKGHSSIIEADMFNLQSPYKGEPEYKFMMAGGSSVPVLPFHGFGPLFICPDKYVKRDFHGAVLSIADWRRIKFGDLPDIWQDNCVTRLEHFNATTTEVYFADTSQINEKMKGDVYINLSVVKTQQEGIINSLTTSNSDLRTTVQEMASLTKEVRSLSDPDQQPKKWKTIQVPVE